MCGVPFIEPSLIIPAESLIKASLGKKPLNPPTKVQSLELSGFIQRQALLSLISTPKTDPNKLVPFLP